MTETQDTLEVLSQEQVAQEHQPAPQVQIAEEPSAEKENWRLMREREKQLQRERDDAHKKLREYESLIAAKNKQTEEDDEVHLNPDDIPEWKHVDKKIKKLESQIRGYQQQAVESAIESRLKSQYPDFDSVVNADTIDMLKNSYPEVAATLNSSTDLYNKAASAYTIIKKMGIVPDNSYDRDKELALRNAAKPRPLASVSPQEGSSGPLSKANAFAQGLTEELKKELYKQMMELRKKT